LWQDLRQVLLDPQPNPTHLEILRRWLRDEVERDLFERLRAPSGSSMVRWACRLAPRRVWDLPFSRADPPVRDHRRIVAILLPHKLAQVERQLAVQAFQEGLTPPPSDET
jgi:hypothetical protein